MKVYGYRTPSRDSSGNAICNRCCDQDPVLTRVRKHWEAALLKCYVCGAVLASRRSVDEPHEVETVLLKLLETAKTNWGLDLSGWDVTISAECEELLFGRFSDVDTGYGEERKEEPCWNYNGRLFTVEALYDYWALDQVVRCSRENKNVDIHFTHFDYEGTVCFDEIEWREGGEIYNYALRLEEPRE